MTDRIWFDDLMINDDVLFYNESIFHDSCFLAKQTSNKIHFIGECKH